MKSSLAAAVGLIVALGVLTAGLAQAKAPAAVAPGTSPVPAIHQPRIAGGTPGRPFLFLIPATGQGPLTFAAKNLPPGLTLDSKAGIITGSLQKAGRTEVELTVTGPAGSASSRLTIAAGQGQLAQTPPMGWNSWNVWGLMVNDARVRAAADAMVASGLAAHGFQYINIDDGWEKGRAPDGTILPNHKFPDMKGLADYVHAKGLKLGIYSSPGPKTCGKYEGSYGHEAQDAATYAAWGIDYLKYDWCSYRQIAQTETDLPELQKPYRLMRAELDQVNRDIVFSLCQYGMGDVSRWGAEVGGNLWRTTGDIRDTWTQLEKIGFSQNGLEPYAKPGHWNDPDMLVVGKVGWGFLMHRSRLTPDEQRLHLTLWSMLAAPLLIGCDMTKLDPFTLSLLTNDEVLEVNQDPLGRQGARRATHGPLEVWSRPLADGTIAVALFNRGEGEAEASADWSELDLRGPQPVRDLWQHQDLGKCEGVFRARVPAHGAVLVKIGKPGSAGN